MLFGRGVPDSTSSDSVLNALIRPDVSSDHNRFSIGPAALRLGLHMHKGARRASSSRVPTSYVRL